MFSCAFELMRRDGQAKDWFFILALLLSFSLAVSADAWSWVRVLSVRLNWLCLLQKGAFPIRYWKAPFTNKQSDTSGTEKSWSQDPATAHKTDETESRRGNRKHQSSTSPSRIKLLLWIAGYPLLHLQLLPSVPGIGFSPFYKRAF